MKLTDIENKKMKRYIIPQSECYNKKLEVGDGLFKGILDAN